MIVEIEVKDQSQADALKAALADPVTMASVLMIGHLLPLNQEERSRVMDWVQSKFR